MKYFWTKPATKNMHSVLYGHTVNDVSICDQLRTMFVHPAP